MDATPERVAFQRKLLAALARSPPAPWREIWNLCLLDPWFKAEQMKHARFVLRSSHGQMEWLDDVYQETVSILGKNFEREPSLHLNLEESEESVLNYICKTIRSASQQALRQLRRKISTGVSPPEEIDVQASTASYVHQEQSLALNAAIGDLPEPLSTIMRLRHLGDTPKEISEHLGMSSGKVYRALRQGIKRLRTDLTQP